MDAQRFDTLVRHLGGGLSSRRQALRGLAAGAAALVAGRVVAEDASAGRRGKKKRCLRAGKQCNSHSECCPKQTGRQCKQPNPPSGSEVCCSMKGEKCGGENANGPVKPQCCFPLECSNRKGGVCR